MAGGHYLDAALNPVDAKARVSVPASFREIVVARSPERELIVGKSAVDDCLIAFDPAYADKLRAEIDARFGIVNSKERAAAVRRAFGNKTPLRIDDGHRITLTPGLRDSGQALSRFVFFVGADEYFELWNPTTYLSQPDADPDLVAGLRRDLAAREAKWHEPRSRSSSTKSSRRWRWRTAKRLSTAPSARAATPARRSPPGRASMPSTAIPMPSPAVPPSPPAIRT